MELSDNLLKNKKYNKKPETLKFQRLGTVDLEATPGFEPGNKGFADL